MGAIMEKLGKKAKDKITGFEGIITAKCDYLYGCAQYMLTPEIDDKGLERKNAWFDEGRVEIVAEGIKPEEVQVEKNGCEYRDHPED